MGKFIFVAAVGSVSEPIVIPNPYRMKRDRSGSEVAYVEKFDARKVWKYFLELCAKPFQPGLRADPTRLSAMGYSMGGQAVWDLAVYRGDSLAAAVPFACACVWDDDSWERIREVKNNLMHLSLRQHSGERDWYAYAEQ